MKKILFFFMLGAVFFSCKKDNLPAGTLQAKGVLHYDNFPDGYGLYYVKDSANEPFIFKNDFSSKDAQYQHFKWYVNVHSTLSYLDKGDTSCLYGIVPVCGIRVVEVVSLQ